MQVFDFTPGSTPLLVSMPHCGTRLLDDIADRMTPAGPELADTDWHVDRLYDFAADLGAGVIRPHYSRYMIDLNRPADDSNLYPGANSTGLVPLSDFAERALYQEGKAPDAVETAQRLEAFWRPYHARIEAELGRLHGEHGNAVLFDAHSIRSVVPRLFEGRLPDLNIGTAGGTTCSPSLLAAVTQLLENQQEFSHVIDGRFRGGYITRAYGDPGRGVHSLQLELVQCLYMQEAPPFDYLPGQAARVRPLLRELLGCIVEWAENEGK
jgi:N-formylglutamate deformylase